MKQNGAKLYGMLRGDAEWCRIVPCGAGRCRMVQDGAY